MRSPQCPRTDPTYRGDASNRRHVHDIQG